jgi:L-ascorbate metabolism protein UlaG (beta-lactamase superfamily)
MTDFIDADVYSPNGHFNGRRYQNPSPRQNGFTSVLRWILSREAGQWPDWIDTEPGPPPPSSSDRLRITFINHTTFLLQLQGINLLTDPIWSLRASPFSWAGPRRRRPPGIRFEDLPPIHGVLLSHDHYDHMDIPTLQRLEEEHRPVVYTGLGNARRLAKIGITKAVELDWWGSPPAWNGIRITAIPAQHFSGRTPFDRDSTLWCGFMVEGRETNICFCGDTAMGPHIRQIAARFPRIDASILPIGAFRPQWFMSEVHMSPEEAVKAHRILGSGISVASHFGTFPLADDGEREPVELLQRSMAAHHLTEAEFWVLGFGEGRDMPSLAPRESLAVDSAF